MNFRLAIYISSRVISLVCSVQSLLASSTDLGLGLVRGRSSLSSEPYMSLYILSLSASFSLRV